MAAVAAAPTRIRASIGDGDLVALVRLGDDDAFEELYRRHHAHVTALVGRMLRDRTRTEDVVQDAFLSALRRLRETESEITFRAWVSEIARNATIDQFRRAGRTREISIDAEQGLAPVDALRLATVPSPETSAIGRERFGHLRGALDELSEAHQRVIVLRELEGHSYREIGQLMDLTPSGVESTLFRARRRLEQEYEQLDSGVRCVATEAAIERLSDGEGSRRDRRKLHRHARRCSTCRRYARENGIEPILPATGLGAKVAALLPFPTVAGDRRTGLGDHIRNFFAAGAQQGQAFLPAAGPAWEQSAPAIGKTLAIIGAAAVIGTGPAAKDVQRDTVSNGGSAARDAGTPKPAILTPPAISKPEGPSARKSRPARAPARKQPGQRAATAPGTSKRSPTVRGASGPRAAAPRASKPTPTSPASSLADGVADASRDAATKAPATPPPSNGVTKAIEPVATSLTGALNQSAVAGQQVTTGVGDVARRLSGR